MPPVKPKATDGSVRSAKPKPPAKTSVKRRGQSPSGEDSVTKKLKADNKGDVKDDGKSDSKGDKDRPRKEVFDVEVLDWRSFAPQELRNRLLQCKVCVYQCVYHVAI